MHVSQLLSPLAPCSRSCGLEKVKAEIDELLAPDGPLSEHAIYENSSGRADAADNSGMGGIPALCAMESLLEIGPDGVFQSWG